MNYLNGENTEDSKVKNALLANVLFSNTKWKNTRDVGNAAT